MLCFFSMIVFGCDSSNNVIQEPVEPEEIIEEGQIPLSEKDFTVEIGTLPYRGAVLFIDYLGEIDISNYELWVEIVHDEKITQRDLVVEIVGDSFVSEIVDLMYLPGDELEFVLKIKDVYQGQDWKYSYFQALERYPWKDWMLADREWFSFGSNHDNYVYGKPSWGGVGAHASWDIWTQPNAPVYSGTIGVVVLEYLDIADTAVHIFNPYIGSIIQYAHVTPSKELYPGKIVNPGEHIANVCPEVLHIH